MEKKTKEVQLAPVRLNYEADLCGNIEQALKGLQGYGIMASELIQNADDAGARTLCFDARPGELIVRNDARFSTCGLTSTRCPWEKRQSDPDGPRAPCNFHAISRMGGRSKIHAPEQIGRFGIGFVSVYQITDAPKIRSVGTELRLNPLTGEALPLPVDFVDGTEFELSWASERSEIRDALNASTTPPDVVTNLVDEVSEVLRSSLIFLRNLQKVEICQSGIVRESVELERSDSCITLRLGPDRRVEKWLVISRDSSDIIAERELIAKYEKLEQLDRSKTVSVAVPIDSELTEGLLYAYLPTQHKTGMPLHINADFFPHASRQDIVLKGEGHERPWNEAMLSTAAMAVGENFPLFREALGHSRLWKLGSSAFVARSTAAFGDFWVQFGAAAKLNTSVWTAGQEWCLPTDIHLPPEPMPESEQAAVCSIGLELLHPSLRRHWTALSSIGVNELRLSTVARRLEALAGAGIENENPHLRSLWSAIARLIEIMRGRSDFEKVIKRLKAATFLIDVDRTAVCPDDVWRTNDGISPEQVRRYAPNCPIVHSDVLDHRELGSLIDKYELDEFSNDLAEIVTDSETAEQLIGMERDAAHRLYELLTGFSADQATTRAGEILSETPFLRTPHGFVAPSRAQLPSGFRDPTGHFEILETSFFPSRMAEFAERVLRVKMLSFRDYIDKHLEEILAEGPTRKVYQSLLTQIVEHKNELDDEEALELLSNRAFVRTRASTFARPDECFFWNADLETLLGNDPARWVDNSWMPKAPFAAMLHDLFEMRLGMPTTVRARHIVERLEDIAKAGTPDEVADVATPIIRHLVERCSKFTEKDFEELSALQDLEFLPAVVDGKRDQENLYPPVDVFRAGRAPGFASQVPVIDLTPLRQAGSAVNDVLSLLGVPEEPETEVIVAHLKHCMETGKAPSDLTYAMLNERVESENDDSAIDELRETDFIWNPELKRFLNAGQVFWLPPPIGDYWWAASSRMGQRDALYRRLEVVDRPGPANFSALVLEIADKADITESDLAIHSRCLGYLCEALEGGDIEADAAIDTLHDEQSLFNVDGDAVWPEDTMWIDSEHLAAPFGSALNYRLVLQPSTTSSAAARFFRRLRVKPISEVASRRLATEPDRVPAEAATERLQNRADLLLWIAPNQSSRVELRKIFLQIQVQLTDDLRIQAEINEFDPPVSSAASSAAAFLESENDVLHIRGSTIRLNEWAAAFRAVFSEIEQHCPLVDVKPLVMTAAIILVAESREEAEEALRSSEFRPPEHEVDEMPLGQELGDTQDNEAEINDISDDFDMALQEQGDESDDVFEDIQPNGDRAESVTEDDSKISSNSAGTQKTGSAHGTAGQQNNSNSELSVAGSRSEGNDKYKSKAGTSGFGAEENAGSSLSGGGERRVGAASSSDLGNTRSAVSSKSGASRERKTRTSRMLAYVASSGHREGEEAQSNPDGSNISSLIDIAAIKAALKYEDNRGWISEEQSHGNPGYDIVSSGPNEQRRIIEVKGLQGEWTERGIKLSHVQFRVAEQYPDEYWIYVVENATDLDKQRVSAIGNPFQKVDEYWFDHNWRSTSEETANSRELNVREGARVRHAIWGKGTIVEVFQRDFSLSVKVDFGFEGTKLIPFNSSLNLVD